MRHGATEEEVRRVIAVIEEMGYKARPMPGAQRTAVGLVGNDGRVDASRLEGLPGVQDVIHVSKPYKQVSREWKSENTVVRLGGGGGVTVGGTEVVTIAGPCSVESERQIIEAARLVKDAGAVILRGGAWKPRTSPYAFQGLGRPGLKLLAKAREETGLLICTEAMDPDGIGYVAEVADLIQIGARNMQNFSLLKIAGRAKKPVLLKRGMSATIEELLLSAEYLLAEGNHDVILCERGIRGFDTATRNVFDLTAIPVVHKLSHLPIIADPSHGTGLRDKVIPMARAGWRSRRGWEREQRGTRNAERGAEAQASGGEAESGAQNGVRLFRVPPSAFRVRGDRPLPRAPIPRPLADPRPRRRRLPDHHQPVGRVHAGGDQSDARRARHDPRPVVPDAPQPLCHAVHRSQRRPDRGGRALSLALYGSTGPNLIGQFVEHPRDRYTARSVRADSLPDGVADVVVLVPKAGDQPYSEVTIWVGRDDGLVRRLDIVEASGQRRTVLLRDIKVNGGVPGRELTFSPPAGVRVVDQ